MERWNLSKALQVSLLILVLLGILFMLYQINPWLQVVFQFLRAVLGPFFIAMVISYLLHPIVNLLSHKGLSRSLSVLLIYTLFIASLVILTMKTVPILEEQIQELSEHLPQWSQKFQQMMKEYNDHSSELLPYGVKQGIENSLGRLETKLTEHVEKMMSGLGTTINQLFLLFITPFLAFYMLKDIHSIERSFFSLFPKQRRRELVRLIRDMDQALGNYVRGQFLVCMVIGVLAYIGYLIVGVPYALLLAAMVAVFNIIPYLGPIFGAIPALFVALFHSPRMLVGVVLVNLGVQVLEGNVISPQIVGRSLHLHPLAIIFALLVGGELGGVWGLILAVPVFAMGKVMLEHIVDHLTKVRV
ncbi:Predicted PurR-regulated permease PerM [Laceyella tengchongensis]|uniref:Predicted PurR-regulated permease PerM n=1 Tax=Laceyella tengchongensis TaxID=574699 RepID=A0AA46AEP1_9BACL|nr:AI-2E family transporter [Laceyella tengchongensis]SMP13575.1 Predicted PurR-regulated permease PerM [Laceyella tengchongensis]